MCNTLQEVDLDKAASLCPSPAAPKTPSGNLWKVEMQFCAIHFQECFVFLVLPSIPHLENLQAACDARFDYQMQQSCVNPPMPKSHLGHKCHLCGPALGSPWALMGCAVP